MPKDGSPLENLRVASPCTVSWDAMKGDDRVRHCGQCRLNVYDLSALTAPAAERLLREREGRLCVRYFRRADGTVLTRDCPVGLRAVRLRFARWTAAAAALLLGLFTGGCARPAPGNPHPTMGTPVAPPPPISPSGLEMGDVAHPMIMGEIEAPPPPAPPK
jgi:hypothetical protein